MGLGVLSLVSSISLNTCRLRKFPYINCPQLLNNNICHSVSTNLPCGEILTSVDVHVAKYSVVEKLGASCRVKSEPVGQ